MCNNLFLHRRLQSDYLQESVPGKHVRSVPALGVLQGVCREAGGSGAEGADRGGHEARREVRRVREHLSAPVQLPPDTTALWVKDNV